MSGPRVALLKTYAKVDWSDLLWLHPDCRLRRAITRIHTGFCTDRYSRFSKRQSKRLCSQLCEDTARLVGRSNKNGTWLSILLDEKQVKTIYCLNNISCLNQRLNFSIVVKHPKRHFNRSILLTAVNLYVGSLTDTASIR